MADIEINVDGSGSDDGNGTIPTPIPTTISEDIAEIVTDNAVTIAAIESDTQVQIAQIEADTQRERSANEVEETRLRVEANSEKDNDLWTAMSHLSERVETLVTSVEALTLATMLDPLPLSPQEPLIAEAGPLAEQIGTEPSSIQTSISDSTKSTQTEPIVENALASLGEVIPPVIETKRGPILKLV